jgi:hypothetical protein
MICTAEMVSKEAINELAVMTCTIYSSLALANNVKFYEFDEVIKRRGHTRSHPEHGR